MGRLGVRGVGPAGISRALRHRGPVLSSSLALALAAGTVVVLAVNADGNRSHDARLNDGGIWVTSNTDGYFGRVNKPIGQLDGGLFADLSASLDVAQDGDVVLGINRSGGTLAPIDPGTVQHPEGEVATITGSADVAARGGTIAVTAPDDGATWAVVGDPELGPVSVAGLDRQAPPLRKAGEAASMSVTEDGDVVVVSAGEDTLTRLPRSGAGFSAPEVRALPEEVGDSTRVTTVGDSAVVLDPEAGRLWGIDPTDPSAAPRSDVPADVVVQQPGPAAESALVSSSDALLAVPLGGGEPVTLAQGGGGRPTAPVRLGACHYGAWSGGGGTVVTVCDGQEPRVVGLGTPTSDLVFRVNRGQVLLNDRMTGAVWNIDTDRPTRLDDWDAFKRKVTESDEEEEQENEQQGDQRPPVANPDTLGARPGRTTVLHPLDNDTAPGGRLLSIRSLEQVTGGQDTTATISPDGQTVQLTLPANATGQVSFDYHIDDGREGKTASATVTVPVRQDGQNGNPRLRPGYEPRSWTVPAAGVLDVPVLPDWRDRADGDPLVLTGATAVGGEGSGAEARTTASGRVRVQAPAEGGPLEVRYTVSDGIGDDVERSFVVNVQDPKERQAFPGVAEPDVITGAVGEPIVIAPLDNDQPGSDPLTPDAQLALAGRLPSPPGAETRTDLVEGEVTVTADTAGTYFLDYDAAYGNAPLAQGTIRVDVRNPRRPPDDPVAMPDTAMISGQQPVLVDVLRNDLDPAGGMLTVQRAEARVDRQLEVAVVDGRWVRVAAAQDVLARNPQIVQYEISNGPRSGVQGEIVVTQREPERDVPVTEKDTVTVRAGAAVAIPALDNDFSPSGGELTLVEDVAGQAAGTLEVRRPGDEKVPTGQAFVTGNFVRYVAPSDIDDAQTFTVTYLAANADGVSSPGKIEVTVVPADRPNQPPEPPTLEGRVVAGDSVTLRLPGADVDPDGDAVTMVGISSAPRLGRVVRTGANSVFYQSFPGAGGTEEFTYEVTDPYGGTAEGTVRVAVAPPGVPQPPLAVDDPLTVEPGRTATIDLLANDHIASGDRVEVTLLEKPEGARLESPVGPLLVPTPDQGPGRTVEVVYEVGNGLASSRGTVTVRTARPYNNPPVAFDAFGPADDGDTVEVDVLETAYDPDGSSADLTVAEVLPPAGVQATAQGGTVTVTRSAEPTVVPFRVEDADGGSTTASLYVPPASDGLPYVVPDETIRLDPGESLEADLGDYVRNPSGGPVSFTLKSRIWPSPLASVGATVTGNDTFLVEAAGDYEGPGAVTFEVTTGSSVDDPDGQVAVLTVPVQVGEDRPFLRCPTSPLEIPQGSVLELDITAVCHVWTADPATADDLTYSADWETSIDGLSIVEPEGSVIEIAAAGSARPGVTAQLLVRADGGEPGTIPVRVIDTPPPSLAPIRIADLKAGESTTVDLAPYLDPGVPEPVPTLTSVTATTDLDVTATRNGPAELTVAAGDGVSGTARFRVVMSDVAESTSPEREATGVLEVEILDVPDTPTAPVPGRTVRSQEVQLSWRAPEANGAPIDYYEVRDDRGEVTRCATTSCAVTGLVNGEDYRFEVRAVNAIGASEWSDRSRTATPDAKPGIVGPVELVERGDGSVTLRWTPPTTQTSAIRNYWVSWPGNSRGRPTREPRIRITGLDNNRSQAFTVVAENELDYGPPRTSDRYQSIGQPGTPPAPTVTDQQTGDDQTAVTVSWAAVDPNGPTPVLYTVERNGTPLPQCTDVAATSCDDAGLTYDGTTYTYRVRATNNGARDDARTSPPGPGTQWSAVGRPAAWDETAWSVRPTGENTMAEVSFTVPPSRGARSEVSVLVDGAVRQTQQRSGAGQKATVSVGDNDRPHAISLRVCNEKGNCSDSGTKNVQAYGPFNANHIVSANAHVREIDVNKYEVWWTITVDNNGDPARVRVTSRSGDSDAIRDESYTMSNVDTQTFTTEKVQLDAYKSDIILVHLGDGSPARAEVRKEYRHTTPERKQPEVRISKGSRCSDAPGSGLPACGGGTGGSELCLDSSCGKILFDTKNFTDDRIRCFFYDSVEGQYLERWIDSNRRYEPGPYYGYPGRQVWVTCNGIESNHYAWPG